MKKFNLILMILIAITACSKQHTKVVRWKPGQPKVGDKVTITFTPRRFVTTGQQQLTITMVCQMFTDQETKALRIPMDSNGQTWQATVRTTPGTYLLLLKFEDQMDRVEDNNGRGWYIIVRDDENKIAKNTYRKLGILLSEQRTPGAVVDYQKAGHKFEQELSLYPANFDAWFDLWNLQIKKSNRSKQQINQVQSQLESLLQNSQLNADLLALAFNSYWKLLNNPRQAIKYGNKLLTNFDNYPQKEEIEFSMIFLKYGGNPGAVINELINFTHHASNPTYLKSAFYQLGRTFQNFQNLEKSIKYFKQYLELAPDDVPVLLNLAKLLLRKQQYDQARQMIEQARLANTEENYFQSHPWEDPQQRRSQLNLNQCDILSTQAALATALEKFQLAINHRKQVIEIGTPFPAFEWVKIGDLYSRSGALDSAQQAYIKAVCINPAQQDAIEKLKFIYQLSNNNMAGFESFLQNEIARERKAAAKPAPDFSVTDLDGNLHQLSDQRDKIVILTFWDSWSSACQKEIPQLNALVEQFKDNQQVVFWAISVEAPISINKFIKENPFHYHLFHTGFEAKKLFKVIGFPTHIVVDPAGKIRFTHIGYDENIQKLLKQEILSILQEQKLIS